MAAPRTRPRTAALCCAAVLGVPALLTGCGGGRPGAAVVPAASAAPAVRTMLDRHAGAVLHHDEAAFLADVDPGFRDRQRQVFRNLSEVPLDSWSYRVVSVGASAGGGGERAVAHVQLGYRLKGYDTTPVTSDADLTLVRGNGHWYVAEDRHDAQQLWDQGPVRVMRGAHSLVLGTDPPAALRSFADAADRAVPAVRRAWGDGWSGRVVVEVPSSLDRMAALLHADPASYRGIAAVTTGELGGSAAAPADRVIINPEAFGELSALGRQVVLTHETTHVATRAATTAATPLWLSEGFADWAGYSGTGRTARQAAPELSRDVAAGKVPARLPSSADFGTTTSGLAQAYEGAWLACRLISGEWGAARLTQLYRAVATGGSLDSHLRAVLGTGLDDFTARWRAYVQRELA
ncbi:hypothetical protein QMK19_07445 [Streptomyces sp. H10-C2]|uniref:hypothetical protein n=1 Tax=unclassified Streptomyces TaxID=2593676 RepID=UPI0024B8D760|nr:MULTISPECIES: hypothetical protein [unclassified Streptomyces]MDJ0341137.1 hypothetical protein [Streptomyces sp. PH10-H1]MDJ0369511.1 hypothetical protein [Streptomyces sp. H10-C2]